MLVLVGGLALESSGHSDPVLDAAQGYPVVVLLSQGGGVNMVGLRVVGGLGEGMVGGLE